MRIVTNTGPLIALAKIDKLSLLEQLFTEVHIPPAVHRELLAKSGPETMRLDEARRQGYWFSNTFLDIAAKLAGEE